MDKILLHDAEQVFQSQPRLIELPYEGRGVFVGDTHGDLEATETVLKKYGKIKGRKTILVFLGDYVDRGSRSEKNVDLLLRTKVDNPERVYLLMGNHEGRKFQKFYPADFWESLPLAEQEEYENLFAKLPYAASGNGLIALHGAPPDVKSLRGISRIKPGDSKQWIQLTWGDLSDSEGEEFYTSSMRPCYGSDYFARVMANLKKNVLIRSHDPDVPQKMFDNRCLTIFTSNAYLPGERTVAIADLGKETRTTDGLEIRVV